LNFVASPETELRFPQRVGEQAKYFGITGSNGIRVIRAIRG